MINNYYYLGMGYEEPHSFLCFRLGDFSVIFQLLSHFRPPPIPCIHQTCTPKNSTDSLLNDLERAVDDCVACVRGLCRDPRFVPGGGASEMQLAHQIFKYGESQVSKD